MQTLPGPQFCVGLCQTRALPPRGAAGVFLPETAVIARVLLHQTQLLSY